MTEHLYPVLDKFNSLLGFVEIDLTTRNDPIIAMIENTSFQEKTANPELRTHYFELKFIDFHKGVILINRVYYLKYRGDVRAVRMLRNIPSFHPLPEE